MFYIVAQCRQATAVYVHTCRQAFRVLYLYFILGNLVTDMHGLAPEEMAMARRLFVKLRYDFIESCVVKRSKVLICVTDSMRQHFLKKYGVTRARYLVAPISPVMPSDEESLVGKDPQQVVYSGGAQVWQCVDEMMQAAAKMQSKMQLRVLTHQTDEFSKKAKTYGVQASILSVPKSEIARHYASATYGFLLRDDNPVNRVACPTKMIEYMYYGIIPIVKLVEIGDFDSTNYSYVTVDDIISGRIPDGPKLEEMRQRNRKAVRDLTANAERMISGLRNEISVYATA
jgi:hypothetical protein